MGVLLEELPLEHLRPLVRVVGTYSVPSPRYQRMAFDSANGAPVIQDERRDAERGVQVPPRTSSRSDRSTTIEFAPDPSLSPSCASEERTL